MGSEVVQGWVWGTEVWCAEDRGFQLCEEQKEMEQKMCLKQPLFMESPCQCRRGLWLLALEAP